MPIPRRIQEDLTMDFVEGLLISGGHKAILVVVDRSSKSAHFISPITTQGLAKTFTENVMTLHGIPNSIMTDKDNVG